MDIVNLKGRVALLEALAQGGRHDDVDRCCDTRDLLSKKVLAFVETYGPLEPKKEPEHPAKPHCNHAVSPGYECHHPLSCMCRCGLCT